jgi:DNA-binding NarL/FixJ family response regulator
VLAPEAAQALVRVTRRESRIIEHDLTPREREALTLLVQGLTNAEIAQQRDMLNQLVRVATRQEK